MDDTQFDTSDTRLFTVVYAIVFLHTVLSAVAYFLDDRAKKRRLNLEIASSNEAVSNVEEETQQNSHLQTQHLNESALLLLQQTPDDSQPLPVASNHDIKNLDALIAAANGVESQHPSISDQRSSSSLAPSSSRSSSISGLHPSSSIVSAGYRSSYAFRQRQQSDASDIPSSASRMNSGGRRAASPSWLIVKGSFLATKDEEEAKKEEEEELRRFQEEQERRRIEEEEEAKRQAELASYKPPTANQIAAEKRRLRLQAQKEEERRQKKAERSVWIPLKYLFVYALVVKHTWINVWMIPVTSPYRNHHLERVTCLFLIIYAIFLGSTFMAVLPISDMIQQFVLSVYTSMIAAPIIRLIHFIFDRAEIRAREDAAARAQQAMEDAQRRAEEQAERERLAAEELEYKKRFVKFSDEDSNGNVTLKQITAPPAPVEEKKKEVPLFEANAVRNPLIASVLGEESLREFLASILPPEQQQPQQPAATAEAKAAAPRLTPRHSAPSTPVLNPAVSPATPVTAAALSPDHSAVLETFTSVDQMLVASLGPSKPAQAQAQVSSSPSLRIPPRSARSSRTSSNVSNASSISIVYVVKPADPSSISPQTPVMMGTLAPPSTGQEEIIVLDPSIAFEQEVNALSAAEEAEAEKVKAKQDQDTLTKQNAQKEKEKREKQKLVAQAKAHEVQQPVTKTSQTPEKAKHEEPVQAKQSPQKEELDTFYSSVLASEEEAIRLRESLLHFVVRQPEAQSIVEQEVITAKQAEAPQIKTKQEEQKPVSQPLQKQEDLDKFYSSAVASEEEALRLHDSIAHIVRKPEEQPMIDAEIVVTELDADDDDEDEEEEEAEAAKEEKSEEMQQFYASVLANEQEAARIRDSLIHFVVRAPEPEPIVENAIIEEKEAEAAVAAEPAEEKKQEASASEVVLSAKELKKQEEAKKKQEEVKRKQDEKMKQAEAKRLKKEETKRLREEAKKNKSKKNKGKAQDQQQQEQQPQQEEQLVVILDGILAENQYSVADLVELDVENLTVVNVPSTKHPLFSIPKPAAQDEPSVYVSAVKATAFSMAAPFASASSSASSPASGATSSGPSPAWKIAAAVAKKSAKSNRNFATIAYAAPAIQVSKPAVVSPAPAIPVPAAPAAAPANVSSAPVAVADEANIDSPSSELDSLPSTAPATPSLTPAFAPISASLLFPHPPRSNAGSVASSRRSSRRSSVSSHTAIFARGGSFVNYVTELPVFGLNDNLSPWRDWLFPSHPALPSPYDNLDALFPSIVAPSNHSQSYSSMDEIRSHVHNDIQTSIAHNMTLVLQHKQKKQEEREKEISALNERKRQVIASASANKAASPAAGEQQGPQQEEDVKSGAELEVRCVSLLDDAFEVRTKIVETQNKKALAPSFIKKEAAKGSVFDAFTASATKQKAGTFSIFSVAKSSEMAIYPHGSGHKWALIEELREREELERMLRGDKVEVVEAKPAEETEEEKEARLAKQSKFKDVTVLQIMQADRAAAAELLEAAKRFESKVSLIVRVLFITLYCLNLFLAIALAIAEEVKVMFLLNEEEVNLKYVYIFLPVAAILFCGFATTVSIQRVKKPLSELEIPKPAAAAAAEEEEPKNQEAVEEEPKPDGEAVPEDALVSVVVADEEKSEADTHAIAEAEAAEEEAEAAAAAAAEEKEDDTRVRGINLVFHEFSITHHNIRRTCGLAWTLLIPIIINLYLLNGDGFEYGPISEFLLFVCTPIAAFLVGMHVIQSFWQAFFSNRNYNTSNGLDIFCFRSRWAYSFTLPEEDESPLDEVKSWSTNWIPVAWTIIVLFGAGCILGTLWLGVDYDQTDAQQWIESVLVAIGFRAFVMETLKVLVHFGALTLSNRRKFTSLEKIKQ